MTPVTKPNPEQKLVLTLKDLQVVLNYLGTRPYAEVLGVIETLKNARTIESVLAQQTAPQSEPVASEEEQIASAN